VEAPNVSGANMRAGRASSLTFNLSLLSSSSVLVVPAFSLYFRVDRQYRDTVREAFSKHGGHWRSGKCYVIGHVASFSNSVMATLSGAWSWSQTFIAVGTVWHHEHTELLRKRFWRWWTYNI